MSGGRHSLRDGRRSAVAVRVHEIHTLACDGRRLRRLIVADRAGEEFDVLVAPEAVRPERWTRGKRYRIYELLGCVPDRARRTTDRRCSDCGGTLREGCVLDVLDPVLARTVAREGLEGVVGVVDRQSVVVPERRLGETVRDWVPIREPAVEPAPDAVCGRCGRRQSDDRFVRAGFDRERSIGWDHPSPRGDTPGVDRGLAEPSGPAVSPLAPAGAGRPFEPVRRALERGQVPPPRAIDGADLFAEYEIDFGPRSSVQDGLGIACETAIREHHSSDALEGYVALQIEGRSFGADCDPPPVNLVVALDVSGSMESPVDPWDGDSPGREDELPDPTTTKLETARRAVAAVAGNLRAEDRLAVVPFDARAHVAKPLGPADEVGRAALERRLGELSAGGGTNVRDGFLAAVDLLGQGTRDPSVEDRVLLVTDATDGFGPTDIDAFSRCLAGAAVEGVHTTVLGIGAREDGPIARALSRVRGATYRAVSSSERFENGLGDGADALLRPVGFDLGFELAADGANVAGVNGLPVDTPGSRPGSTTEGLVHVGTVFPPGSSDGIDANPTAVVRLEGSDPAGCEVDLRIEWTERGGRERVRRRTVMLPVDPGRDEDGELRNAIVLERYARNLRTWSAAVHECVSPTGSGACRIRDGSGSIGGPTGGSGESDHHAPASGRRWGGPPINSDPFPTELIERWAPRFDGLRRYLAEEMAATGDERLQRELVVLDRLRCRYVQSTPRTPSD